MNGSLSRGYPVIFTKSRWNGLDMERRLELDRADDGTCLRLHSVTRVTYDFKVNIHSRVSQFISVSIELARVHQL